MVNTSENSLPIYNSSERMLLNSEYNKYFENKTIYSEEAGCYTIEKNRKKFCHNDIYALAVKDGYKEIPQENFDDFVKFNCSKNVIKYYFK